MSRNIIIRGAAQHNLKNLNIELPRNKLIVITGLSGSGKSSLAFDTIYAEGQRRYVESLSSYARQFLGQMEKPKVASIEGLSPAISIEQKTTHRNPRSTVGTVTEIYDYLRLLFARVGHPHFPTCGREVKSQPAETIVNSLMELPFNTKIEIRSPVVYGKKGRFESLIESLLKNGFVKAEIDGEEKYLEETIRLDKNVKHSIDVIIDRIKLSSNSRSRIFDSVETALSLSNGIIKIFVYDIKSECKKIKDDSAWIYDSQKNVYVKLFSEKLTCTTCGISIPDISPRVFSFNNPYGACQVCHGLGYLLDFDETKIIPDKTLSIREGAIRVWSNADAGYTNILNNVAKHYGFSIDTPFGKLKRKEQKIILYGTGKEKVNYSYQGKNSAHHFYKPFEGIIPSLQRRYKETSSERMRIYFESFMSLSNCKECGGTRLQPYVLSVLISGKSIVDLTAISIRDLQFFFNSLNLEGNERIIAEPIIREIKERLQFMIDVGIDYLTLDRRAGSLSGGEAQRIRLATQIGSGLVGVLYILDEPSIGLHQRDNKRLIDTLIKLRNMGNTVIVVEHDEDTIKSADYILDLGPGAGKSGGYITEAGPPSVIMKSRNSLTGDYLSARKKIPLPTKRVKPSGKYIVLKGVATNNLKNIDVAFPVGLFTVITGVSGSGKSSLINDTLYPAIHKKLYKTGDNSGKFFKLEGAEYFKKAVNIDQSPIGRTPRSNPATYTKLFDIIRRLFASLPEANIRGYTAGRFSFNVKGGRCEACQGGGVRKIEMHFLPDIYITCDVCGGKRYNSETLEVKYRGNTIYNVLEMTVNEALDFFKNIPEIKRKLEILHRVGLGYIHLGQPSTTLSGGEAQRIKLAAELSRVSSGDTLYILDEPTTGLHFDDILKLLKVLLELRDKGNTIIVIEHNLDVIKTADYIIDLGPEGGDRGGKIIAKGSPEEIIKAKSSYTAQFLYKKIMK